MSPDQFVPCLDHMDRDTNRGGRINDAPRDGLADPPPSVGGKSVTKPIVELLGCPHEPYVPFLDEV